MYKKCLVPRHPLGKRFNGAFSRKKLARVKDREYVINLHDKKIKKHIAFHYILTETQLCTLICLGLNIFFEKY